MVHHINDHSGTFICDDPHWFSKDPSLSDWNYPLSVKEKTLSTQCVFKKLGLSTTVKAGWNALGPKNKHFGKTHFRDLNIVARIFICFQKLREIPDSTLCLAFFTNVPKNGPKKVRSSKNAKKWSNRNTPLFADPI